MKAIILLAAISLASCSNESSLLQQAVELSHSKKFTEAEAVYRKLVDIDDKNPLYHNNYGWVLMQQGNYSNARHHFERAAELGGTLLPRDATEKNLEELAGLE